MPVYSPLCDTDLTAYLAYLSACICDGSSADDAVSGSRCCGGGSGGSCSDGDGGVTTRVLGSVCCSSRVSASGVDMGATVVGDVGGVGDVVGACAIGDAREIAGLASCDVGSVVGCVDSVSGDGVDRKGKGGSGSGGDDASGSSTSVVRDAMIEDEVVSDRTLKNREKRLRKKKAKARKRSVGAVEVPEWRRGAKVVSACDGVGVGKPVSTGYFSKCDVKTQDKLRESRAAMLIAKNNVEAARASSELSRIKAEETTDVVAREMELRRLSVNARLKAKMDRYFDDDANVFKVRTIVSEELSDIIPIPEMSAGSMSPGSSISVEKAVRLENALARLSQDNVSLRKQLSELSEKTGVYPAEETDAIDGLLAERYADDMRRYGTDEMFEEEYM